MVFCIVALPVLLILSIFSAKYRELAKESFLCFLKKATFRPCQMSTEQKLKKIVFSTILKRNEKTAFFFMKHFQKISAVLMLIFIASLVLTGIGIYNVYLYGNCNGPGSTDFCAFSPNSYGNVWNMFFPPTPDKITPFFDSSGLLLGNENAKVKIVEVGCYSCPYTFAAERFRQPLLEKYGGKISFSFHVFPLPSHTGSDLLAQGAFCAIDQDKYWEFRENLFPIGAKCSQGITIGEIRAMLNENASNTGLNMEEFNSCIDSEKYSNLVTASGEKAILAGVYATPTFFINDNVLVSPKTIEEIEEIIDRELTK